MGEERSRSRMQSEERTFGPDRSRSRMQSEERTFGFERSRSRMESEERSLAPQQQNGGVSGEDMMTALEEFRRRRGVKEKAGMGEGSNNDEWGVAGKDWEWDDGTD